MFVIMLCKFFIIKKYIKLRNFKDPFNSNTERILDKLLIVLFILSNLLLGFAVNPIAEIFFLFTFLILHQLYSDYLMNELLKAEFGLYADVNRSIDDI